MRIRIYRRLICAFLVAAVVFVVPSRLWALNPLVNEERPVHVANDAAKTVTVIDGMVWYDTSPAAHGIRFPPGVYVLEAEDSDYRYFRSPAPLEFRIFKDGKTVDGRNIQGGIMLTKHIYSLIPGAGYIDDTDSKKIMLWKLGGNFLLLKGKNWKTSF